MEHDNTSILLKSAASCSIAASLLLILMLGVTFTNGGVSQQHFETVSSSVSYMTALQETGKPLRLIIGLDNLFILAYSATLIMGAYGLNRGRVKPLTIFVSVGVASLSLLDLYENTDFLRMLAVVQSGGDVALSEIGWRMQTSLLKWQVGYLSLFLFSFLIPAESLSGWLLKCSLWVVLPLIGFLLVVTPNQYQYVVLLARYGAMLSGFILFAIVFLRELDRQS